MKTYYKLYNLVRSPCNQCGDMACFGYNYSMSKDDNGNYVRSNQDADGCKMFIMWLRKISEEHPNPEINS